jgi:hypothetical protein
VETDGVLGPLTTRWAWCGPSFAATTWALMGAGQRRPRRSEGERGEEQEGTHHQAILAGPSAAELICLCVGGAHEVSAKRVHRGCGDGMRAGARLLTRIWWARMVVFGDGGAWVFCSIGVCQRCRIGVSVSARVICALGSIDLFPPPVPESGAFLPFYSLRSTKSSKWRRWLGMTRTAMSRVRPVGKD